MRLDVDLNGFQLLPDGGPFINFRRAPCEFKREAPD
jgi:hypothetical protein